eukprot:SAG31_NODE_2240_length_6111_cov_11.710246_9_plen_399_part_00
MARKSKSRTRKYSQDEFEAELDRQIQKVQRLSSPSPRPREDAPKLSPPSVTAFEFTTDDMDLLAQSDDSPVPARITPNSNPADPADLADPTNPANLADPVGLADPTNPADLADPTCSAGSIPADSNPNASNSVVQCVQAPRKSPPRAAVGKNDANNAGKVPQTRQDELGRLIVVIGSPEARPFLKMLCEGLTAAQLDAMKSEQNVQAWVGIASIYNDRQKIFLNVPSELAVNQFHIRDGDWCKSKWSHMKSRFSIIRARMDKSGEGSDLPFSNFVHKTDWAPKVMILLDQVTQGDPAMFDFAVRKIGSSLAYESQAAAPNPPGKKKQKQSKDDSPIAEAMLASNKMLADAMNAKARAANVRSLSSLIASEALDEGTRDLATRALKHTLQQQLGQSTDA